MGTRVKQQALHVPDGSVARRRPQTLAWFGLAVMIGVVAAIGLWSLLANGQDARQDDSNFGYEIVKVYPHDAGAFTQGLVYDDGILYEGTGKYGESSVRKVDLESGRVLQHEDLSPRLFGEGITILGDDLYQLTWKAGVSLVYHKDTFRHTDTLRYKGEGWGITHNGTQLIISNGTSTLQFVDPKTFRVVRRLNVTAGGRPVDKLNELEYIDGQIYANIWYSDYIARISPETGVVTGWIDLRGILPRSERPTREHVLNGIAFDAKTGHLLVTGKNWPKVFEIKLVPKP